MSTSNQKLLNNENLKAPHGIMSLPPLFQINLEQTLIDRIRPFLRSFFSDINIREEIIENFVLAVKEYKELHLDEIIFNSPAKAVFPGRKNKLKNLCKLAIKKVFLNYNSNLIYEICFLV